MLSLLRYAREIRGSSKFIHDHSRLTQVESGKVQNRRKRCYGMNRKEIESVAVYKISTENAMVITLCRGIIAMRSRRILNRTRTKMEMQQMSYDSPFEHSGKPD